MFTREVWEGYSQEVVFELRLNDENGPAPWGAGRRMFLAEIRTSTKIKVGRSFPVSGTEEKARHRDVGIQQSGRCQRWPPEAIGTSRRKWTSEQGKLMSTGCKWTGGRGTGIRSNHLNLFGGWLAGVSVPCPGYCPYPLAYLLALDTTSCWIKGWEQWGRKLVPPDGLCHTLPCGSGTPPVSRLFGHMQMAHV